MSQTRKNPYSITSSPAITQCTTIESVVSRSPITCVAFDRVQVRIYQHFSLSLSLSTTRNANAAQELLWTGTSDGWITSISFPNMTRYSSFCLKYEDRFKKNTRGGENVKSLLSCGAGIGALTPSSFRIHDRGGCTRAMYVIDQENKYKMHCAAMNLSETHVAVGSSSSSKEDALVRVVLSI